MDGSTYRASAAGGAFMTFEGPEGSGKSTQIQMLAESLAQGGIPCLITREPGGSVVGDRIRGILLERDNGPLNAETEAFLMLAQRSEHLQQKILPALREGAVVICDRFFDSTLAYQGFGRGLDIVSLRSLHEQYLRTFLPDLTIVLDLDPQIGLERAKKGGRASLDRMESEALEFHRRVRQGYLTLAAAEPERFIVLSALDEPASIARAIRGHFEQRFSRRLPA